MPHARTLAKLRRTSGLSKRWWAVPVIRREFPFPRSLWFVLALTIMVLCPTPYAIAQGPSEAAPQWEAAADSTRPVPPLPEESYEEPIKNLLTLALGGAIWPSLGNKEFGTTTPRPTIRGTSPPQASRSRQRITGTSHTGSAATSISAESLAPSFLTTKILEIQLNLRRRRSQAILMRGCGMPVPALSS